MSQKKRISVRLGPAFAVVFMLGIAQSFALDSSEQIEQWIYFEQSSEFWPSDPPTLPNRPMREGWYAHQSGLVQYHKLSDRHLFVLNEKTDVDSEELFRFLDKTINSQSFGFKDRGELAIGAGVSVDYVPAYSLVVVQDASSIRLLYGGATSALPKELRELHALLKQQINSDLQLTQKIESQAWLQADPVLIMPKSIKGRLLSWLKPKSGDLSQCQIYKIIDSFIESHEIIKALQYPFYMVALTDIESAAKVLSQNSDESQRWIANPRWNINVGFQARCYRLIRYDVLAEGR